MWKLKIEIYLFTPLCNYECHCANFHATYAFFTSFFYKNCTEFHANPAAGFVIDCGPKTDRQTHTDVVFTHRPFLLYKTSIHLQHYS
jgi:hypothetical protein